MLIYSRIYNYSCKSTYLSEHLIYFYRYRLESTVSEVVGHHRIETCLTNPMNKSAKASNASKSHCPKENATPILKKTPSTLSNAQPSLCQKMRIHRILTNVIAKNKLVHIKLKILRTHAVIRSINRALHL